MGVPALAAQPIQPVRLPSNDDEGRRVSEIGQGQNLENLQPEEDVGVCDIRRWSIQTKTTLACAGTTAIVWAVVYETTSLGAGISAAIGCGAAVPVALMGCYY